MKILVLFWSAVLISSSIGASAVYGQNEDDSKIREAFGFRYDLPADYPIRKINGVVKPAPLSEYVFMKVEEKNEKIDQLEKRIEEFAKELEDLKNQLDGMNSRLISSDPLPAEESGS